MKKQKLGRVVEPATRMTLRKIVDVAWNEATESEAVPSTDWADRIIDFALGLRKSVRNGKGSK